MNGQLFPAFALLFAAAIWGFTFPLVKEALHDVGPFEFLAIRFALATAGLAALFPSSARTAMKKGLRAGLITGGLLAIGHGFQTAGLDLTKSTNAGFITGLYVVFTPLFAAVILKRRPSALVLTGVVLVTSGLTLMSLRIVGGRPTFNTGDLLVLVCAMAYGGQIVAVGRYAPESDPRALTIQQLAVTCIAFTVITPLEGWRSPNTSAVWIALAATSFGSSVYGITVQTWAQQRISPTRAAIIYSSEAPFAALFAYILASERLPSRAWLGAALILAGMLAAEIRPAGPLREG